MDDLDDDFGLVFDVVIGDDGRPVVPVSLDDLIAMGARDAAAS